MIRRFAFVLPIMIAMILFSLPARAVTLPPICAKWISCGHNAYFCAGKRGESCKNPSFVVTRPLENWSQKQSTATKVSPGVTMKSQTKIVYRYISRNGKRVKVWYRVTVPVTTKKS